MKILSDNSNEPKEDRWKEPEYGYIRYDVQSRSYLIQVVIDSKLHIFEITDRELAGAQRIIK